MTIEQEVSKPQKAILISAALINLFLAGVGSGKTYLLGIITYRFIKMFPNIRGFIGANTYLQLQQSTLFRIREYWKLIGIIEYDKVNCPHGRYVVGKKPPSHFITANHNFDDYYGIISFINGAVIFLGSMDNASAHAGKELGWGVLDETKDTDEFDVKEIILTRLRQRGMYMVNGKLSDKGNESQQYNPLFISTSPAKTQWIAEWFDLETYVEEINDKIYSGETFFHKCVNDKCVVISSTYHNIKNVGQNYINNIINNNTEERGKALIFANPFAQTGGEYYSSFSRLKHVGDCKLNKDIPLHITFDFNAVPYNTLLIFQIEEDDFNYNVYFIDEICLQNPRNSTEELCDEFIKRYDKQGLFIYGDATGRARTITNKLYRNQYEIIFDKLKNYINNYSDRVPVSNKPNIIRRDFINKIFENKLSIRILIDKNCHTIINDLTYTKQGPDGLKDKRTVKDEVLGSIQKWGHAGDALEYGICEAFKSYIT